MSAATSGDAAPPAPPALFPQQLRVSAQFDGGNIDVLPPPPQPSGADAASSGASSGGGGPPPLDPSNLRLAIRPEPFTEVDGRQHYQWFAFQVSGAQGVPLTMRVVNAGGSSYPEAWRGYQACASYDLDEHWFRVPTTYDEAAGELTISHTPQHHLVRYAYFATYGWERHCALLGRLQGRPRVQLHTLGSSLDGRDMTLVQVGEPAPGKASVWVIARQHPGETMAEWFAEGLLERLTADDDGGGDDEADGDGDGDGEAEGGGGGGGGGADGAFDAARDALLRRAVVFCVPNMCPDGSVRGHLRTNAVGANLNREWAAPTAERSPEVLCVKRAMERVGLDMLLDVHGDEEIAANFIGSMFGVPNWGPRLERLEKAYIDAALAASPDFQTSLGYPLPPAGGANLSTASKACAHRFDTLSLVLEQPFKDCIDTPHPSTGWSPARARMFGAAHVAVLAGVVPAILKERATKGQPAAP